MNKLYKIIATFLLALGFISQAKAASQLEETMFKSGKAYTFLTVALVVLTGIFLYLLRLDKKVSRMEKEMGEKK